MKRRHFLHTLSFLLILISFVGVSLSGRFGIAEYYSKLASRFVGLAYFSVSYVFALPRHLHFLRGNNLLILLYILLALVSCFYSPHPLNSGVRALELLAGFFSVTVICAALRDLKDVDRFLDVIYLGILALLCFVAIGYWLAPREAISYLNVKGDVPRLGGHFVNPNSLGIYSGLLAIGSLNRILRMRSSKRWYLLLISSLVFLALAKSRTATIGTILSGAVSYLVICYKRAKLVTLRVLLILMILGPLLALFADRLLNLILRGESVSMVSTATGRVDLWVTLLQKLSVEKFFLGSGFQMLTDTADIFRRKATMYAPSAHNAFMQALSGLGIFGLALLVIATVRSLVWFARMALSRASARQELEASPYSELLSLYSLVLIYSFFEAGIGGPLSPVLLIYLFLITVSTGFDLRPPRTFQLPTDDLHDQTA